MLDKETPRGKEKIRVYYLENATAEELAKVLSELPTRQGAEAKGKGAPALSEDIRITADKATNSLIISAASDDYVIIEEIINGLHRSLDHGSHRGQGLSPRYRMAGSRRCQLRQQGRCIRRRFC
jgi:type II secretory pathway component GspD/PulD (secretin)